MVYYTYRVYRKKLESSLRCSSFFKNNFTISSEGDTDRHLPAHVCVVVGSSSERLEVTGVVKVFIPHHHWRAAQTGEMQVEPRQASSPSKQCAGSQRKIPAICYKGFVGNAKLDKETNQSKTHLKNKNTFFKIFFKIYHTITVLNAA